MDKIDRKHSRLLDVYLWSEHQGLSLFCDELWEENFKYDQLNNTNSTKYKKMFKLVVLNLYIVWLDDETLAVGLSMSPNEYKQGSRYSQLFISRKIIPIVRKMHKKGLIDLLRGSEQSGKTTRIRATSNLIKEFELLNLCPLKDIMPRFIYSELVVLQEKIKVKGTKTKKKILHEYEDTPATNQMKKDMLSYNNLLHHTHIDIPTLKKPHILHKGKVIKVSHLDKLVQRIFYRGTFELGGRLHGGFWQKVGSKWRSQIYMDGGATVEADYSGLHISLLFGLQGEQPPQDPYTLDYKLAGFNKGEQRAVVKRLMLTTINAKEEIKALDAFRDKAQTTKERKLKNIQLKEILDAFCTQHPLIKDSICKDKGVELMRLDGEIAMAVVNHFTEKGIPILSVHDSFIIHCEKSIELKEAMNKAASDAVGCKINISQEHQGLDEVGKIRDEEPESNVSFTNTTSVDKITKEYKQRLQEHEGWRISGINCLKGYMDMSLVQPNLYQTLSKSAEEHMRLVMLEQEATDTTSNN